MSLKTNNQTYFSDSLPAGIIEHVKLLRRESLNLEKVNRQKLTWKLRSAHSSNESQSQTVYQSNSCIR